MLTRFSFGLTFTTIGWRRKFYWFDLERVVELVKDELDEISQDVSEITDKTVGALAERPWELRLLQNNSSLEAPYFLYYTL